MSELERWMRHALTLAARGRGAVEPNPMVGAVVLDPAGKLIGEGWHQKFGGPHAEVFALQAAGARARGGTLFVTLEPCCHHGKTPPCTDAVLRAGVARVVAAMADPFPRVAGGGLALLRAAGVDVQVGLCEADARALNAPYLKLLSTGRPWVHAKWAMTLDGKLAARTGDSKWISGAESRRRVHELRGRLDAILVGRGTVVADDPLLTARPAGVRTAARVVLTASGELPAACQLRATAREAPVLVYTANPGKLDGWAADGAEVVGFGELTLDAVLADLGRRRFTNVLLEGGAGLLGAARDADVIDEFHVFIAPKVVGGSAALTPVGGTGAARMAEALTLEGVTFEPSGADVYAHGFAPGRVIV
ncbi:bifunctional diaminohydroxyphosphoribosylaminopyrimidine deaminase/5-amino-6-(5-phosphoribosylamino)uracil reductase RibD [Gemmata sp. JC717]|uniref:bifunctional diaminohydroxyphosphoribosylaminopyrimidine deaminase/5-amino-6-(5-phosphoribosylamino)uracil reductase RibD n=1 Tax=Gemmata algarum TaxID=2975278 RepID=UPI0021BA7355|nr:bifunctional diaminohydroxyphosphoribosylaminopyrimidine deaminase/5-amino-6-(5-phosphoribosylamino)uracil reductase RibD [Gemmata algarum]MDY3556001.1 bifunctional diaminohydroxyphosphoribosylaminopyrimidine deaminase/5-amino-6-(5-phosphoribosylamino)uracil reductase RibD [Gemmata algarum]